MLAATADEASRLSRHYIASRYPDAHPSGPPAGHYRPVDASQARGDFNEWSDLDVLVVADDLPADGRARLALLVADAPAGCQPIGWTRDELAGRRRRGDPIAVEADTAGVVVYGALRTGDPGGAGS